VTTFFAFALAAALLLAGFILGSDGRTLIEKIRTRIGVASGIFVGGAVLPLGFALMWRSSGSDARLAEMSKLGYHKDLRLASFGSLKVLGIGTLMNP